MKKNNKLSKLWLLVLSCFFISNCANRELYILTEDTPKAELLYVNKDTTRGVTLIRDYKYSYNCTAVKLIYVFSSYEKIEIEAKKQYTVSYHYSTRKGINHIDYYDTFTFDTKEGRQYLMELYPDGHKGIKSKILEFDPQTNLWDIPDNFKRRKGYLTTWSGHGPFCDEDETYKDSVQPIS